MPLKLVIFDLDGTLLVQGLDFAAIRAEIGLPPVVPILETMEAMEGAARERAFAILDRHEAQAAAQSTLMPGALELLADLRRLGVRTAVLTRNSRTSVEVARRRHGLEFDAAVTRESHRPKPCPDGIRHLMRSFGAAPAETVVVGDYRFDIDAGRAAGVRTIALLAEPKPWAADATWAVGDLAAVGRILAAVAAEPP
ncbi:MAG: HAD family hydrolase [Planctomycetes bacterium]|nr:HAD family hydrolase [Planctomycetota bacterium]